MKLSFDLKKSAEAEGEKFIMVKSEVTFMVNGVKQTLKMSKAAEGELLEDGRWKSFNYSGSTTVYYRLNEKGEAADKHVFDKAGKEIFPEGEAVKKPDTEKKFNEQGKIIYERNKETGDEAWSDYNEKGLIVHKKFTGGSEHFFAYDDSGEMKESRIEENGKVTAAVHWFWSDDRRFWISKSEDKLLSPEAAYSVHEYFYDAAGKKIKEILWT